MLCNEASTIRFFDFTAGGNVAEFKGTSAISDLFTGLFEALADRSEPWGRIRALSVDRHHMQQ
eukprot:gene6438-3913_t